MEFRNTPYEFSVYGRVDLNGLYDKWSREQVTDLYTEPAAGWRLKLSYVFNNDVGALLFENAPDDDTSYYRVLFYGMKDGRFGLLKKVRFRVTDAYRVEALSIDNGLESMFVRRAGRNGQRDFCCYDIGGSEKGEMTFSQIKVLAQRQSDDAFAMTDGMTVLFFKAPEDSRLQMDFDPHDIMFDANTGTSFDDEEKGDDTECRAKVMKARTGGGKTAMDELNELIGLGEIKDRVNQITAFAKLQKMAEKQGRRVDDVNINMSFLGNPGTAKTTVARIFARIMKENGILSKGDLIEVGRAELIAKYVGQTAIKVKEVFKKARGSVLFIDEAYSLVDNWENEYGDEAIATIVQEMENNRDDMIVIFAGYPDKMEKFLSRNPGLRSRVPYSVVFRDYSADELMAIAKSEASRRGYALGEGVEEKIHDICSTAMKVEEFGNGRFSRNLVESAIMRSAARAMSAETAENNLDSWFILETCDFTAPDNLKSEKSARPIGFRVA